MLVSLKRNVNDLQVSDTPRKEAVITYADHI